MNTRNINEQNPKPTKPKWIWAYLIKLKEGDKALEEIFKTRTLTITHLLPHKNS